MSNERLNRLEERLAWLERHVTEQDKAMLEMAGDLARLKAELIALRERQASAPAPREETNSPAERPPHY